MKIFALSDLHLSFMVEKPMDIFGGNWENHTEKLKENWQNMVSQDDLVLIAGDISWAMKMEETQKDLEFIESLNGRKIIIKGNHEYWWKSVSNVRAILPKSIMALQNDAVKIGNVVIAGTRGWDVPESENDSRFTQEDQKLYAREQIRMELALESAKKLIKEGDTLIYMIHYPPFNSKREDSEFTRLLEKYGAKKVVYGHLHKSMGRYSTHISKNGIDYYLTSADLIEMKPMLIEEI